MLTTRFFIAVGSSVLLALMGTVKISAQTIRVASISFEPTKFDLASNADQLEAWLRQAAAGGAKIAVAPEGILEGYVVNEIIAGEVPAQRMREVALTIESATIRRFQELARERAQPVVR